MKACQEFSSQHRQTLSIDCCCSHKSDLPGWLTMCISHTILPLVTCTLLLLASTSGEGQLHKAHENTPDMESMDSQAVLLLEAVKTGILSSLGMDVEPRLTQKASKKELREMYQLYRRKIREIRGNSSQPMGENSQSTMSTVLFPGTDENSVRRGRPLELL